MDTHTPWPGSGPAREASGRTNNKQTHNPFNSRVGDPPATALLNAFFGSVGGWMKPFRVSIEALPQPALGGHLGLQ